MPRALNHIKLKVSRAEKRMNECLEALQAFTRTEPYEVLRKPYLASGKIVYSVIKADPVPPEVMAIAGEAIQGFRTALDYLPWGLVPTPSKETYFPILLKAPQQQQFQTDFDGRVRGAHPAAIKKIAVLNAYKGGDEILWPLHQLNIIDKHRLLVGAGASATTVQHNVKVHLDMRGSPDFARSAAETFVLADNGYPLEAGKDFFVDQSRVDANEGIHLLLEVVFNEPGVCEGWPVIDFLREAQRRVKSIVGELYLFLR